MQFLRFFSPVRAYRDLRLFLAQRRRHELGFMGLSLALTMLILFGLYKDADIARPYKKNIVYVESWRLDRSDAEIAEASKEVEALKAKREAEWKARQEKRQAEFKKVDDWLTERGI